MADMTDDVLLKVDKSILVLLITVRPQTHSNGTEPVAQQVVGGRLWDA